MSFCIELANYALRIWDKSLADLIKNPLPELLDDFRRIRGDFKDFEAKCYGKIDSNLYGYYESVFSVALLKLSVAIEDKVRGREVQDEYIKFAIDMFTPDEKNVIREFERFSGIDPKVVSPEALAEIIVSGKGEIYQLVKEAVSKQYIDFANIIKSWSSKYSISDSIRRGLIARYEARFKNVVEAVKKLLDQQPAWLRRLFAEYEEALLSSAEVREKFEKMFRDVYEKEVYSLRERIDTLEKERSSLIDKLNSLSEKALSREVEAKAFEEELSRLRREYEDIRNKYFEYLKMWEEKGKELEELKSRLIEKEKQLEEMALKEKELTAAKEALEAEVVRLRNTVSEYEARVKEYERYKEELQLELKAMEDKVNTLEKGLRGELKGHLVTAEEAAMLELIFIEKLRSKLREVPIAIKASWGEVVINKWSYERVQAESMEQSAAIPRNMSIVFGHRSRGFLGLGEERVVEVIGVYLSHISTLKEQGFDSQPATLSDLLNVLRNSLSSIEGGKRYTLIGIASPTGWEESVTKYVAGEAYSLVFSNAAVILVDLIKNRAIYPEKLATTMPSIDRYARMFIPEVMAEEEKYVENVIRDLCDEAKAKAPENPVFLYKNLVEKLKGISKLSIIRVMSRYREKGSIEIKSIGGEKAIVCRSAG
jgi:predicted  nucleic acid-binding Zn-ribbon protein